MKVFKYFLTGLILGFLIFTPFAAFAKDCDVVEVNEGTFMVCFYDVSETAMTSIEMVEMVEESGLPLWMVYDSIPANKHGLPGDSAVSIFFDEENPPSNLLGFVVLPTGETFLHQTWTFIGGEEL